MIPANVQGNTNIKAYASTFSSGEINATLINTSAVAATVEIKTNNFKSGTRFYWYALEGGNDNGEFSRKVSVNGSGTALNAGGPSDYATIKAKSASTANSIKVTIPAWGAVCLAIDKK